MPARPRIQKLVRPDKFIVIPDPKFATKIDLDKIAKEVPEDTVDLNWRQTLAAVEYDRAVWTITKIKVQQVRGKRLELVEGPKTDTSQVGTSPMTRNQLEELKEEVKDVASGLLVEAGFGGLKGQLYGVIIDHIREKILGGKSLSEADSDDVEFAITIMESIRKTFTKPVIAGILAEKNAQT